MGKYFDGEGKLNPLQMLQDLGEELSKIATEEVVKDAVRSVAKGAAISVAGAGTVAAVSAGGTTAAAAVGGGALGVAALNEVIKENEEHSVEVTTREEAQGGVPYEEVLQKYVSAENESTQIAQQTIEDNVPEEPFAAFQKAMADAGMETVSETNTDTSCLPQKASRELERSFSLN
ncbi:MAG: hypothetical protein P8P30_02390 [Rickettsiales bacterium]|nr:hypothetical protein [Rickettsiales bacterium]